MRKSIISEDSLVLVVESLLSALLGRRPTLPETFHAFQSIRPWTRTYYLPRVRQAARRLATMVR